LIPKLYFFNFLLQQARISRDQNAEKRISKILKLFLDE